MADTPITLRLTIADPVPGVRYSLQKDDAPHEPVTATDAPLSFDVPIRLADDNRMLGPFVRREGKDRRFVYIRIGTSAGDHAGAWSRRAKIDIHDIPPPCWTGRAPGRRWRSCSRAGARTARPPVRLCGLWRGRRRFRAGA